MKKMTTLSTVCLLLVLPCILFSCSSDDNTLDIIPANKLMIYPASLILRNTGLDGTRTEQKWGFSYDADHRVKSYETDEVIIGNQTTINDKTQASLTYYTDVSNTPCIKNKKNHYYKYTNLSDPTLTNEYTETITEDAVTLNGMIKTIIVHTERTSLPDSTLTVISGKYTYTYSGNKCTGCTYQSMMNNKSTVTTYHYNWNGENIAQAQVDFQDVNNNVNNDSYVYTWNANTYATVYTFRIGAFILGPKPEIYGAMGYFGDASANLLQKEVRDGYHTISNERYQKNTVVKNYSFYDNSGPAAVTVNIISPSYTEYLYQFK